MKQNICNCCIWGGGGRGEGTQPTTPCKQLSSIWHVTSSHWQQALKKMSGFIALSTNLTMLLF